MRAPALAALLCFPSMAGAAAATHAAVVRPGTALATALDTASNTSLDTDQDGISDALENTLLQQFKPQLVISRDDCSTRPARFLPGDPVPTVSSENGTLYGQAFPHGHSGREIELHYYHLWRRDCGEMGHALDTEHVSVLLRADPAPDPSAPAQWRAVDWYAAAHEDTVCDASQITRASTLDAGKHNAEASGATIWISAGKHASFLNEQLCHHGCGGDRCTAMESLHSPPVVNLGELRHPDSGAVWVHSTQWPLAAKMTRTDFTAARLARLDRLPANDIAWVNPAKRPAQALIASGNTTVSSTAGSLGVGGHSTDVALVLASRDTDGALGTAGENTGTALGSAAGNTGEALGKSSRSVWHALGAATHGTAKALGADSSPH